MKGYVPNAIRKSFNDLPDLFMFMNRGLVISANKVSFDNKSSQVTIQFTDLNLHGLLDGGHTYNIITEEALGIEGSQFVKVEILEGFGLDDITQLVDARNTSNQVKDESLMNLQGDFEDLKKALKGATFLDKIAFSEYETDENNEPKPIDIREVIAILTAFDKENFTDLVHPINAYRSKIACLGHFKAHRSAYKKIYPLAKEILELYDHIQDKLPSLYNASGGKFGRLTGVTFYGDEKKGSSDLFFINKESKYAVPDGFVYPILGSFRALLEEKAGKYTWAKGISPVKMLEGPLGKKLAATIGQFALDARLILLLVLAQMAPFKKLRSSVKWLLIFLILASAIMIQKRVISQIRTSAIITTLKLSWELSEASFMTSQIFFWRR
jgi:AIPR protein